MSCICYRTPASVSVTMGCPEHAALVVETRHELFYEFRCKSCGSSVPGLHAVDCAYIGPAVFEIVIPAQEAIPTWRE